MKTQVHKDHSSEVTGCKVNWQELGCGEGDPGATQSHNPPQGQLQAEGLQAALLFWDGSTCRGAINSATFTGEKREVRMPSGAGCQGRSEKQVSVTMGL